MIPQSRFWYTKCQDLDIKAKVEKIWPLCHGKAKTHYSKLIAKEFALGIVAEKLNKVISWATFVEKTDTNQRSKYFKQMNNMEVQRKNLMKAGKVLWLKQESQVEEDLEANDTKLETPTNLCVPKQQQASKQWTLKLQGEVVHLLQLASMELKASRSNFEQAQKEKQKLVYQLQTVKMLMELILDSLMEEKDKTRS